MTPLRVQLAGAGDFGFASHRIPALTTTPGGTILAAWDGRPHDCHDAPQPNSILLRTSSDHGLTWSEPKIIAAGIEEPPEQMGFSDPSFVVDRVTGTVFLFCVCSFDWGWHDSANRAPHHPREALEAVYLSSPDGGETWTGPVSVTDALNPPEDPWTARFASSGEGIQLRHKSPGRLIQQFTIRRGADRGVYAVSLYSDDHGHTWRTGELVGPGVDENKTVELSDGRIMLNSRPATPGTRLVAVSTDAGHSYTTPKPDPHLPDPANNGSIMRLYPDASPGSDASQILVFSGANSTASRRNGTLRMSYDDGATWPAAHEFQPGQMQYSTATPLADGSIGVLYEHTYSTIYFTRVS